MRPFSNRLTLHVWIVCLLSVIGPAFAVAEESPEDAAPIVLGMSTVLTGPAADLGLNMKAGVDAAIREVNARGGIGGRPLHLVALDDGYEPSRTAPNMRQLVHEHRAVAIIGNVGTPTAVASLPIVREAEVPFVGAFTGAGILRTQPPDRYIVNFRASYAQEIAAMIEALIEYAHLETTEIGFFTQRDAYGDAGFLGGVTAMRRAGLSDTESIPHARYERNTLAVENAVADLLQHEPPVRAVIMVGAYAPCAKFVRLAREYGLDVWFLNVSFVGSESLAAELGADGDGVLITQVVPSLDSDLPAVRAHQAAMLASDADRVPTLGSLEGYLATRMLIRALESIDDGAPINRERIIAAIDQLGSFDLGLGTSLHLDATHRQASDVVWPTEVRAGRIVPFEWSTLAHAPARIVRREGDE